MNESFFERPILNSPYARPPRHWELDEDGQPTNRIIDTRRRSELITPVPKPQRRRRSPGQGELGLSRVDGVSTDDQEYNPTPIINEIRSYVAGWRNLPNPNQWQVTPETARLLQHWRHHQFDNLKPFFCQIEAVETAIWLAEVASQRAAAGARIWTHIRGANREANPELLRIALKLASGAGKTTVMAMLIAWQTVNAAQRGPTSRQPQLLSGFRGHHAGNHDQGSIAFCCRTIRTATTASANSCLATCSATWSAPRSSSPTITPSAGANAWRSRRPGGRCCKDAGRS